MKNLNYIISLFLLSHISCKDKVVMHLNFDDIITEQGNYNYVFYDEVYQSSITIKIKVSKIENSGNVFAVADLYNKTLYQTSIFTTFNNFSKWGIYFDKVTGNVWFYTSDLENRILLKYGRNEDGGVEYKEIEYKGNIEMPQYLKNWLEE